MSAGVSFRNPLGLPRLPYLPIKLVGQIKGLISLQSKYHLFVDNILGGHGDD